MNIKTKSVRGFTLIELLVVIAIIGLLSTIVVASLTTVRKKARDTKRVADIKSLQLALEMYFDANSRYPDASEWGTGGTKPMVPKYVPAIPVDPSSSKYAYTRCNGTIGGAAVEGYHLGASLEDHANAALSGDSDSVYDATACPNGGEFSGFSSTANSTNSATTACGAGAASAGDASSELCYDIRSGN